MQQEIKTLTRKYLDQIIQLRRNIHEHPELSFEEVRTSRVLREFLSDVPGVEINYPIAGEGFTATINGGKQGEVRVVRGDMDALPIQELADIPFASKQPGLMHACGHDVHSACLAGAVRVLADLRSQISGTLRFVFQPAEEKLPGGASLMIQEGVLQGVDSALAQHVFPELNAGQVGFRPGMYMASCDEVHIRIVGKGGHGAMPHAVHDPVFAMSQLISGLQSVVSRLCPPAVPCVLSFGKVQADGATNVIPSEVFLEGTFRTMDEDWREKAHSIIVKQTKAICQAHQCEAEVEVRKGYPFLMNNPELTAKMRGAAIDFLGSENVVDLPLRMTGEDFAFISHKVPSCFYRLGVGFADRPTNYGVHHPKFEVNEKALETGVGLLAYLSLSD